MDWHLDIPRLYELLSKMNLPIDQFRRLPSTHWIGNLACMKEFPDFSHQTASTDAVCPREICSCFLSCSWPNTPCSVALEAGTPETFSEKKYYAAASGSIMTMSAS